MAGTSENGLSSSSTGPRRQNKRLKLGLGSGSGSREVHSLLAAKSRTTDVPIAGHATSSLGRGSVKASPAPALLSSALGVVSTADFEAELAKQLLGVIPESNEAHGTYHNGSSGQQVTH